MKIKINSEKIGMGIKRYKILLIVLPVIVFISLNGLGLYLVINPPEDKEAARIGQAELDKLDTVFNKKIIGELEKGKASTVIEGPAGRNPFLPY